MSKCALMSPVAAFLLLAACTSSDGKAKTAVSKNASITGLTAATKSTTNTITAGQPVKGALETTDPRLNDQSHYDEWIYEGRAGENVQISMESAEFDTYLILGRLVNGQVQMIQENDDGAGGTNARITATLPENGSYGILANSYGADKIGSYTLRLEGAAGPTAQTNNTPANWAGRYPGGGNPNDKYALLVGINDYQGIGNSLDGPVADARLIGRILVERYGFKSENVIIITDKESTRGHLAEAFRRHLGQAGPNGVAVFYYSGHGMQMDSNYANADPEADEVDEAIYIWGDDGRGGVLIDDELGMLADGLQTDRVLLILDACFSGTGTRAITAGGEPKITDIKQVKSTLEIPTRFLTEGGPARSGTKDGTAEIAGEPQRHLLLSASADNEVSWTASGWPKYGGTISVFTYYLAEALEAAPQNATFSGIMQGVQRQTNSYARSTYRKSQTPQTEGRQGATRIRDFLAQR